MIIRKIQDAGVNAEEKKVGIFETDMNRPSSVGSSINSQKESVNTASNLSREETMNMLLNDFVKYGCIYEKRIELIVKLL